MITQEHLRENTEDARHGIHFMGDKPTEVITCDHTRNVVPAHRYLVPDRLNMMHTVSLIILYTCAHISVSEIYVEVDNCIIMRLHSIVVTQTYLHYCLYHNILQLTIITNLQPPC